MRVLVVSNMYPSEQNRSFGVFVQRISDLLSSSGFDVTLCVKLFKKNKLAAYISFYLRAFCSTAFGHFDVIHVHFLSHSWLPVALGSLFSKAKLVGNVHGADVIPDGKNGRLKLWAIHRITQHALNKCDVIIAPSHYFKMELRRHFTVSDSRVAVSPSGGVDTDMFAFSGFPSGKRRILFLGRLIAGKGVLEILPALRSIMDRNPNLEFEVIFAGDGPLRDQLQRYYSESEVNATFLGDVSPNNVPSVIVDSHFMVFPSFRKGESLGLVVLEAMSCGRPVIAADSGAIREIITDGEDGFIFPPKNSCELSRVLERALTLDDIYLSSMSYAARRRAQEYGSEVVKSQLRDILMENVRAADVSCTGD